MQKPVALVTGASGGIGSGIAKKLISDGFAVVLHYHSNENKVFELVKTFLEGADYLIVSCDLTDAHETKKMISLIHSTFGKISLLVNCAGIAIKQTLFSDTDDIDIERVFQMNVFALMRITRLLLDDLRLNGGNIINISSMWGLTGASCEVIYSASKAAIIGFTKSLAKELAPSGVRVNAVAPGLIPTKMNSYLTDKDKEYFRSTIPLERFGSPEDVASAVSFLSNSDYITGQTISVDGGVVI